MKALDDIKALLCKELEDIADRGTISQADLDVVYKAVDVIKDISKINAMCDEENEDDLLLENMERLVNSGALALDDRTMVRKAIEKLRA